MGIAMRDIQLPSVIICDDHQAIRAGLGELLREFGVDICASVGTVSELLAAVGDHPDALVISDLGVESTAFRDLMAEITDISPGCRVIIYSMRDTPSSIRVCYDLGAYAFVPKSSDVDEIVKALRWAASGMKYFPDDVAAELEELEDDSSNPRNVLTGREFAVFMTFVHVGSAEAVAERQDITLKTTQNLLGIISKKLGVPRSQFHRVASENGLLDIM